MAMPDPKNEPMQGTSQSDPPVKDPVGGLGFRTQLFGGSLNGSGREIAPDRYLGNADYNFANGDQLGAQLTLNTKPAFSIDQYALNGKLGVGRDTTLNFNAEALPRLDTLKFGSDIRFSNGDSINANWNRTGAGQIYGADSAFMLGKDGNGTASFRVDEPADTARVDTKLQFNPDFNLNADWNRTAAGQIYGADSAFKLGKDGNGTASFRVDEPADTARVDTKLQFNPDFNLNADWNRTAAGQIYGADSAFKLGKDGNGTASFRVDEPADTARVDTKLQFNPDFNLNADWNRTAAGQIYGADSAFKLGKDGNGTASFRVDEPADTARVDTKLQFNPDFNLNADWNRTAAGQIYGADSAFKLGKDGNGTASFRVDEPADTARVDTKLQFNPDFNLNADWNRTAAGQIYGADSAFKLGKDGNGTASFRVDEPADTARVDTKLQFNPDFNLNADWNRTAAGQIYGADSAFKLGKDGNGTASFRVDEPADTARVDTKLQFNPDFNLNADWNRTAAGQIYGADSAFKLGKDGNGTASFRVDEPSNTSRFDTNLKFNDDYGLSADWSRTAAGQIYGADSVFKLGKEGSGAANFRVDEPASTTRFDAKFKFDNGNLLNADWMQTRDGQIYGADGTFGIGNGKGSASLRVDEPANTTRIDGKLQFANGNLFSADLTKSAAGNVFGADGAFGIGQNGKGLAGFRIDEINHTSNYKLGASFDNGNSFNAQVMSDRLGTTLGLDGKLAFDKGAGSVMLDGKFGPRTDLGASINYKNDNLEYSGHVRANNEFGPMKVSEFGAKVSTSGNERYKFSAEAGYRPETNEYYGKVGLTIQFGGSSKPHRPITSAQPSGFEPERSSIDDAAAAFKQKQSVLLQPENKKLYDQAVAGVEKLNTDGAKLPVGETAASLTLLAKNNGLQDIQYVALGNQTSTGRQNLFIGDGDPSNPATKQTFMDKTQAVSTPMHDSIQRMTASVANSADNPTQDAAQVTAQRR
jgi:hypothetical protein